MHPAIRAVCRILAQAGIGFMGSLEYLDEM